MQSLGHGLCCKQVLRGFQAKRKATNTSADWYGSLHTLRQRGAPASVCGVEVGPTRSSVVFHGDPLGCMQVAGYRSIPNARLLGSHRLRPGGGLPVSGFRVAPAITTAAPLMGEAERGRAKISYGVDPADPDAPFYRMCDGERKMRRE